MTFLTDLGVTFPLVQAPMAGVATPALAAAVSNAGALGSVGVGATDAAGAHKMISDLKATTDKAFNVNVFVHKDPIPEPDTEALWCAAMEPLFARFGAAPPDDLRMIYRSFAHDDDMLRVLLDLAPPVVSFHFGLPDSERIKALKDAGCTLFATATSLPEAKAAGTAGIDAIVAQGFEAGGHRGIFDPNGEDAQMDTETLTRLLVSETRLPVISAGGIMDGAGIRDALSWGAVSAQMGTAFVACDETSADAGYRTALATAGQTGTVMTKALSGRPARCLVNQFTTWADAQSAAVPPYPIAYDALKSLNAAAKTAGESGFGAQWAGTGAPRSRAMPASELVATLIEEFEASGD